MSADTWKEVWCLLRTHHSTDAIMTALRIMQTMSASTNITLSFGARIATTMTKARTNRNRGNIAYFFGMTLRIMTSVRGQKGESNDNPNQNRSE